MTRLAVRTCVMTLAAAMSASAQSTRPPAPFHWHDDYTEYHLRAPETNQFHIVYYKVGPVGVSWERVFIEPRVTIVLPAGFELTGARTPVTTGTLPDGRMYVQAVNNRVATAVRLELWAGKIQ